MLAVDVEVENEEPSLADFACIETVMGWVALLTLVNRLLGASLPVER